GYTHIRSPWSPRGHCHQRAIQGIPMRASPVLCISSELSAGHLPHHSWPGDPERWFGSLGSCDEIPDVLSGPLRECQWGSSEDLAHCVRNRLRMAHEFAVPLHDPLGNPWWQLREQLGTCRGGFDRFELQRPTERGTDQVKLLNLRQLLRT